MSWSLLHLKERVLPMNIKLISSRKMKKYSLIKWGIFLIMVFITFLIMTAGTLIKPNLFIPLALCIALYEEPFISAVFGSLCGIACGIAYDRLLGYDAILILAGCVFVSLICTHLLRQTFFNLFVLNAFFTAVVSVFNYFLFYVIWGYEQNYAILKSVIIPEYIMTVMSVLIIYPVIMFIRKHLTVRNKQVLYENPALIKD